MNMPIGGRGTDAPKEKPKGGVFSAYLHGIYYIGTFEEEDENATKKARAANPQAKVVMKRAEKAVAVFEVDQRKTNGERFIINKELGWSLHEKSLMRKTFIPEFRKEAKMWDDERLAAAKFGRVRNESHPDNICGPCTIKIRTTWRSDPNRALGNPTIDEVSELMVGHEAIVPEHDFSEQAPWFVTLKRGQNPEMPAFGLVEYRPEKHDEPHG